MLQLMFDCIVFSNKKKPLNFLVISVFFFCHFLGILIKFEILVF